jgi:nitrogen-specific signal transduction histidine kinase/CheY-like chemotaxis protein
MRSGKPNFTSKSLLRHEAISGIMHRIGHEIGNPLTSVISLSTLIERAGPEGAITPEKLASYARAICAEAWRISSLNEKSVLMLSDRAGKAEYVEIEGVLHAALAQLRRRFPEKDLELQIFHRDNAEGAAFTDPNLLLWIFTALLENCMLERDEFPSVEKSGHLSTRPTSSPVSAQVEEEGTKVMVSITNCAACRCENLSSLFDPFVTRGTKNKRLGLGLTVVAAIVWRLGGEIELEENTEGEDVFFTAKITLPRAQPIERAAGYSREQPLSAAMKRWGPALEKLPASIEIAIVEDEAAVGSAMKKIIELVLGTTVKCACSILTPDRFLDSLKEGKRYHALLCDMHLGITTGAVVLEQVRDLQPSLLRSAAVVTGDNPAAEHAVIVAQYDLPLLKKPFEADALLHLVLETLLPNSPGVK